MEGMKCKERKKSKRRKKKGPKEEKDNMHVIYTAHIDGWNCKLKNTYCINFTETVAVIMHACMQRKYSIYTHMYAFVNINKRYSPILESNKIVKSLQPLRYIVSLIMACVDESKAGLLISNAEAVDQLRRLCRQFLGRSGKPVRAMGDCRNGRTNAMMIIRSHTASKCSWKRNRSIIYCLKKLFKMFFLFCLNYQR